MVVSPLLLSGSGDGANGTFFSSSTKSGHESAVTPLRAQHAGLTLVSAQGGVPSVSAEVWSALIFCSWSLASNSFRRTFSFFTATLLPCCTTTARKHVRHTQR